MEERNFLILVEGRNDTTNIFKIIKSSIEIIAREKLKKYGISKLNISTIIDSTPNYFINDTNSNVIVIDNINFSGKEIRTKIYIKRAINQNLKTFIEDLENNQSLEKIYNIKNITYTYSIFDYDPGSTTLIQLDKYFNLKFLDNIFSIINYPGIEAQEFHYYSDEIISSLENIKNISEDIDKYFFKDEIINKKIFYLKNDSKISSKVKKLKKIIMQYMYKNKLIDTKNIVNGYYKYFDKANLNKDSYFILDNQKEYSDIILKDNRLLLISFVIAVVENIVEWLIDEEE